MTATDLFTFRDQQVRTVLVDGEPWFVAADVARILGYRDAHNMVRRVEDEDRGTHYLSTPSGDQDMTVVNEPGLYAAVLGSQIPEAKAFKRWLTHEVLPAIRRTGQFGSQVPASLAEALELAALEARRIETLEAKAAIDAPKVEAFAALMDADGFYTMEAAAKMLGIGRNTMYRKLRQVGIIQNGLNLPYQRHMHHFAITAGTWTDKHGNIHPSQTARVRPSGLDYLRRRLAESQAVAS